MYTTTDKEKTIELLNDWYVEMRARNVGDARSIKEKLELQFSPSINDEITVQDEELLLYYALLDFRYSHLVDNLRISKDSFNKIESFSKPLEGFLAYYYHFFKAIYFSEIGNFNDAREEYEKADNLLKFVPDKLEKAEFYYKLSTYYYYTQQALLAVKYASKAKDIFSNYDGNEINKAFCDNVLGLACTYLQEWELAEEHFAAAMDQFQKIGEERFILMTRHNLGWLYAKQNLSDLSLRYLSEVVEKSPNHYKAIYVKAKEHFKLGQMEEANELIERGLKISYDLQQEEYQHRNMILKALNNNYSVEKLEDTILTGITYFDREELYDNVQDYYEILGAKCYEEELHVKSSKYFYLGMQAKKKSAAKGALI